MRLALASALLALAVAAPSPAVPQVEYVNPIAGFSIEIPEDWEMATGTGGYTEIAIDAPVGAAVATQPALWFFRAKHPAEEEARLLARDLGQINGGAEPTVAATGREGEWEVSCRSSGVRGELIERWRCRDEAGQSYVIGALARPGVAEAFGAEIDRAFETCRLVGGPVVHFFQEPTENAYRMVLPVGWTWEGQILRTGAIPGYFVWKVQSQDGLTGCFSSPPAALNITVPYTPADELAGGIVLDGLRQQVPDAQLESVHSLPRVGEYFGELIKLAGLGENPRVHKVRADYLGTRDGTQVRVRIEIVTFMLDASPLLEGRGNWFLMTGGAWAPEARFDQRFALARGVMASLWTSPRWKANQARTVQSVLGGRRGAMDEAAAGWDALIRDMDRVPDPDGGDPQEVPNRDGGVWKDPAGVMHRVPSDPDTENALRNRGWKQIQ